MAKSAKDIQLSELKNINSQLNMTIKILTDTIIQKDKVLADMQMRLDEINEEMKLLRKHLWLIGPCSATICTSNTLQTTSIGNSLSETT